MRGFVDFEEIHSLKHELVLDDVAFAVRGRMFSHVCRAFLDALFGIGGMRDQ